jgi:hypothetical protein
MLPAPIQKAPRRTHLKSREGRKPRNAHTQIKTTSNAKYESKSVVKTVKVKVK